MLVRVGIAVTCSVAALTFSQLKSKSPLRNRDDPKVHNEESIFDNFESQQKTPEEEVKRVNPVSPARSLHGGSDYEGPDLLLPEFEDLLHSTELGRLSPCVERNNSKDFLGAEGFTGGDSDIHKKPPNEQTTEEAILVHTRYTKSRARGKVGSRRSPSPGGKNHLVDVHSTDGEDRNMSCGAFETSDLFPDEPDFLLGEYVDSLANDAAELEALRNSVKDLKEKETELFEYYGLRKSDFLELEGELEKRTTRVSKLEAELQEKVSQLGKSQSDLEEKKSQITKLKTRMGALESRTSKLSDEAASVGSLKKDLDEARARSRELQKQVHSDSGNARAELLMLKQKLVTLEAEKQDGNKRDMDIEKKLQTLRELEVEVVELRRTSKELQHQKRELIVKLTAAETEIEHLQNVTESDIVGEADANVVALRHENEDLCRQVEGLQNDRFTEVEELVYLRWVNACLRYELRNYQVPAGTSSALDLNKSLSPKSQEKAKQLMLQYAGPDLLAMRVKDQMDSGYESPSSEASTPSEEVGEYSDASSDMGSGRLAKKPSLIRRLKKWTGRKDDGSDISSASSSMEMERSFSTRSEPPHHRKSSSSKGPLEALILKNASDANEITTFGANKVENAPPRRSVSDMSFLGKSDATSQSNLPLIRTKGSDKESANGIAASFQLMSKSVPQEISAKYPAFKDRHKAAMEREQTIKEKAQVERSKVAKVKFQKGFQEVVSEKPASEPTLRRGEVISKPLTAAEVEKRATRKPNPPPKPSGPVLGVAVGVQARGGLGAGPPPPPPPPPRSGVPGAPPPPPPPPMGGKLHGKNQGDMQRAPEVVEFYQSLMKRDVKSNAANGASGGNNADARNNMIGEIENRSAHLLAIKADVETQGEFVMSLSTEVRAAVYTNIEDVVAFVSWLDDELSFLVDETAVLKHFDWPESKADAMRESAFEYQDLMKLLAEVSVFEDKPEIPCEKALKKMLTTLEKMEQSVYGLLRTRDMAIARYKEFGLPTQWLLDSGVVGKIKSASVKLARLYMKRVASELDRLDSVNEPVREFLLLQGVRFAFRVHQFAGGFDPDSMRAFEALRDCAHARPQNSLLPTDEGDEEGIQEDDDEGGEI